MTHEIINDDVRAGLRRLPDESVHMVCTSPPYWSLRCYQTNPQTWGGVDGCEHVWGTEMPRTGNEYREGLSTSVFAGREDKAEIRQSMRKRDRQHLKELGERLGCGGGNKYSEEHPEMFAKPRRSRNATDVVNMESKQATNKGAQYDANGGQFCQLCGAWRGELGSEPTVQLFVEHLVDVFREVKRVLRKDGVCFVNLGDSYAGSNQGAGTKEMSAKQRSNTGTIALTERKSLLAKAPGLKPKDLCLVPERFALAMQDDGWWVRSRIIWCLSGGTRVYARTQKGDMPMTLKDLYRLPTDTVQLWNGNRWTQLRGMHKSKRKGDELVLVLRSGERIACTPTHRFPTDRGLLPASEIRAGDVLESCKLPEPETCKDYPKENECVVDEDAAWFAGLYIAEGSMAGDTIQIAGHAKENARWERLQRIAAKYGGYITRTVSGNNMSVRMYGKVLRALLDELVSGKTAHDKSIAPVVWRYSNPFIDAMLSGYLAGDGHWDGSRWRLGFCRNHKLADDLRTACARLGYALTLNTSITQCKGKQFPAYRGEIRMERNGHHNERDKTEVVAIEKSGCRYVYDLGVEDEPRTFALASGVITHNSKPNPMPESTTDRPTKSHEHIWMFTKSGQYFWDQEAVREENAQGAVERFGKNPTISRDGRKYEGMDGVSLAAAASRMPV